MKHQYFGDVNDYRKYGLLRVLQSEIQQGLHVAWMLTPDDGSRDGSIRGYLRSPERWRGRDAELFDGLAGALSSAPAPHVSLIERSRLLGSASYHSKLVPYAQVEREAWSQELIGAARGAELVFLDPGNGVQGPSKPVGWKGSSKYVTWAELEGLWAARRSLLIYQHFVREPRGAFTRRLAAELRSRTGASLVEGFRTAHVLFLFAAQDRHVVRSRRALAVLAQRWAGQIDAVGLTAEDVADPAA